jgi:hypothetical protein
MLPEMPREWEEKLVALGEPTSVFKVGLRYIVAAGGGALVLVGLAVVIGRALPMAGLATLALAVVAVAVPAYRHAGLVILEYPVGLLSVRRGRVDSFLWKEITDVRLEFPDLFKRFFPAVATGPRLQLDAAVGACVDSLAGAHSASATSVSGKTLRLRRFYFKEYRRLVGSLVTKTFEETWPAARANFSAGARIEFGTLALSHEGIVISGSVPAPWQEIDEVSIQGSKLQIRKRGRVFSSYLCKTRTAEVPNLHLCVALLVYAQHRPQAEE